MNTDNDNDTDTAIAETISTYTVTGMTCGHCVASVAEEISKVDRVTDVAVDLASGQVTITSDGPLDGDAVAAAVDEAGYAVAP
jgi:copper chaperone